jgi:hypothetical protein
MCCRDPCLGVFFDRFMSRKKRSRARPRSLLTPKQGAFVRYYTDRKSDAWGNATRACQRAGYKGKPGGNQLAVQGARLLRNPNIQAAFRLALAKQGFTLEFGAKILMEAMNATEVRVLPNRKGKPVLFEFPNYAIRLQGFDRAMRLVDPARSHHGKQTAGMSQGGELPRAGELLESEKAAKEVLEFSAANRMFMRSAAEKVRAMLKLVASDESSVKGEHPGE